MTIMLEVETNMVVCSVDSLHQRASKRDKDSSNQVIIRTMQIKKTTGGT